MSDKTSIDDVSDDLGRENVSVTFGVEMYDEIVGPMKFPKMCYGNVATRRGSKPLIFFHHYNENINEPPWWDISEFVMATEDSRHEYTLHENVKVEGIQGVGSSKTMILSCERIDRGIQCDVISRHRVAKKRDMRGTNDTDSGTTDGSEFRVSKVLG